DAEETLRDVVARSRTALGETHHGTLAADYELSRVLMDLGKVKDALPFAETLWNATRERGKTDVDAATAARWSSAYGLCLAALSKFDAARQALEQSKKLLDAADLGKDPCAKRVAEALAACDLAARAELAAGSAGPASRPATSPAAEPPTVST